MIYCVLWTEAFKEMSVKCNFINGLLYTETEDVVPILENELPHHGTSISDNVVFSDSQDKECILKDASATSEDAKCINVLKPNDTTNYETTASVTLSHPSTDEDVKDTQKLIEWLKEAGLSNVFPYLKDAQITFDSLQYLDRDDIREAIPAVGIRAKFRSKLFAWRKEKFGLEDGADSLKSDIKKWVQDSTWYQ